MPAQFSPATDQPEHRSIARFRAEHRRLGGTGRIIGLPDSAHTAALAAEALGCEIGAIANSLLFEAGGRPVLILTSGGHRVDTDGVARTIGAQSIRRARPDFVKRHTGQAIGGVSPLGHPEPLPTFIDSHLAGYEVIWAAAGHPAAVYATTYDELKAMTHATTIAVRSRTPPASPGPDHTSESPTR
ncbi:MAG: YbaK/EbsC family protein [Nocardioides sp.]